MAPPGISSGSHTLFQSKRTSSPYHGYTAHEQLVSGGSGRRLVELHTHARGWSITTTAASRGARYSTTGCISKRVRLQLRDFFGTMELGAPFPEEHQRPGGNPVAPRKARERTPRRAQHCVFRLIRQLHYPKSKLTAREGGESCTRAGDWAARTSKETSNWSNSRPKHGC